MRYTTTHPLEWLTFKLTKPIFGKDMEPPGTKTAGGDAKRKTILENSWTLSYKTSLPYDPEICFLDIHPKEMKTWPQKKGCTKIFLAALFIKAKS